MAAELLSFKASEQLKARLTEMSESRGLNRSAAIKAAILEATAKPGESSVPDEDEVLVLLGEAARAGSVAAMKELRTYHREQKKDRPAGDMADGLDEFAARRPA